MSFKLWGLLLPYINSIYNRCRLGRWYNLSYSMLLLYFYTILKIKIILFEESNLLKKLNLVFFSSEKSILFLYLFV